ncbi:hypothetical protein DYH09_17550 [bacterium CPR1]|nr:hypothetical protein [bacterium CPR1]
MLTAISPTRVSTLPARSSAPPPEESGDRVTIGQQAPAAPKKWTILVYSASDNDLKSFMLSDLDEAERVGSDAQTNVVAQFDHGRSDGAKRYLITQNNQKGINSPPVQELGSTNMSDPKQLANFIQWGMERYPAENYMLIISDHGNGWKGAAQDYSHNGWMSLPDIEAGMKEARQATGRKIDVVGFDACLMASVEVAHQLRDEADFLVASEEVEGGAGWPYHKILNPDMLANLQGQLALRLNLTPREVCQHVVRTAKGNSGDLPTMSATELSRLPALTQAVDGLAAAILTTQTPMSTLKSISSSTQGFTDYKDLYDFAERVNKSRDISDQALKDAAGQVVNKTREAVIFEQHASRFSGAHGLTVELSPTFSLSEERSDSYSETKFAQDTRWAQAVSRIASGGPPAQSGCFG